MRACVRKKQAAVECGSVGKGLESERPRWGNRFALPAFTHPAAAFIIFEFSFGGAPGLAKMPGGILCGAKKRQLPQRGDCTHAAMAAAPTGRQPSSGQKRGLWSGSCG